MSKNFLKNKESGEIDAAKKKGVGLSFLFGAQCLILGCAVPVNRE
jgi:hypothetical protein